MLKRKAFMKNTTTKNWRLSDNTFWPKLSIVLTENYSFYNFSVSQFIFTFKAGADLDYFLNEACKTVGNNSRQRKIFVRVVAKNCLKLDLQGIRFLRTMRVSGLNIFSNSNPNSGRSLFISYINPIGSQIINKIKSINSSSSIVLELSKANFKENLRK